jgi:hypothetical protein
MVRHYGARLEGRASPRPRRVIFQGGRLDERRPEGEVLADVQRALAAQGAPLDVLTSGDWITVREIVSPKPQQETPDEAPAKLQGT